MFWNLFMLNTKLSNFMAPEKHFQDQETASNLLVKRTSCGAMHWPEKIFYEECEKYLNWRAVAPRWSGCPPAWRHPASPPAPRAPAALSPPQPRAAPPRPPAGAPAAAAWPPPPGPPAAEVQPGDADRLAPHILLHQEAVPVSIQEDHLETWYLADKRNWKSITCEFISSLKYDCCRLTTMNCVYWLNYVWRKCLADQIIIVCPAIPCFMWI